MVFLDIIKIKDFEVITVSANYHHCLKFQLNELYSSLQEKGLNLRVLKKQLDVLVSVKALNSSLNNSYAGVDENFRHILIKCKEIILAIFLLILKDMNYAQMPII